MIEIELKENNPKPKDLTHLIYQISRRHTNRNKYLLKKISQEILDEVKKIKIANVNIHIVDKPEEIGQLSEVAVLSSIESMVDREFRQELSHHLKHNFTRSPLGMPGFTLGIPTPISILLPHLIKRFNMEKVAQKQNEQLFKYYTPYIFILTTKSDLTKDWLETGQVFERISLILTKYGISTSPWGAPIQIGTFYQEIQKILNSQERPQMFFRVGYAAKPAGHSPRLSAEKVLQKR